MFWYIAVFALQVAWHCPASALEPDPGIPPGWEPAQPPNARDVRCTTLLERRQVYRGDQGEVLVARGGKSDRIPAQLAADGELARMHRRTILAVVDGFIVGVDNGEWGGWLRWYSYQGAVQRVLGERPIAGVYKLPSGEVVAIENRGSVPGDVSSVVWFADAERKGWSAIKRTKHDWDARAVASDGARVYVALKERLLVLASSGAEPNDVAVDWKGLIPDSMLAMNDGTLWVALGNYLVRLVPSGSEYSMTWLLPVGCKTHKIEKYTCTCVE